MLESDDKNLVEKIFAGEKDAETLLFRKYGSRIARKVSFHLGADNRDWQDVTANVQMALLLSLRQGKFDVSKGVSLGAYIYGITNNKIKDYFKALKKQPPVTNTLPEHLVSVAEIYDLEKNEARNYLRDLLGTLKIKYKEVLYLRYYEELSIEEISQKTGLPPRRVSERIHYAITLMRKKCEKEKIFSILISILIIYSWILEFAY